jgi:[ribosomal protein S18]-alanine N-acetyltransferase
MGNGTRSRASDVTAVELQAATFADLPDVVELERRCYGDPWPASAFSALPDNASVFFHLTRDEANGSVTGYVIAWYVMDEGELANLAVAPDYRRRGIGTALLDAMLADALSRGVDKLYLEVRESNLAARHLYASRKFEEVGRRKQYYRSPQEDALILRRTLKH